MIWWTLFWYHYLTSKIFLCVHISYPFNKAKIISPCYNWNKAFYLQKKNTIKVQFLKQLIMVSLWKISIKMICHILHPSFFLSLSLPLALWLCSTPLFLDKRKFHLFVAKVHNNFNRSPVRTFLPSPNFLKANNKMLIFLCKAKETLTPRLVQAI